MRVVFLTTQTPKYPRQYISVNNVPAQKLNGISRKFHCRIVKSNEIYISAATGKYMKVKLT